MIGRGLRRVSVDMANRSTRLVPTLRRYRPTEHGKALCDSQYAGGEWDHRRSIGEALPFGVVSAYCRLLAAGS